MDIYTNTTAQKTYHHLINSPVYYMRGYRDNGGWLGVDPVSQGGPRLFIAEFTRVVFLKETVDGRTPTQDWADLTLGNLKIIKVTLNSDSIKFSRILPGEYNILRPDYSHASQGASTYSWGNEDKYHSYDVWFPIVEGDNSKYIHPGQISHGCVTIF